MDFLLRDDNSATNEPVPHDEGASGSAFWGRKRRFAPRCSLCFLATRTRSVRAFAHCGMSVHSSCRQQFATRTAPIASAPCRFIQASSAAPGRLGTNRRGLQHDRQWPYGWRSPEGSGPAPRRWALLPGPPTVGSGTRISRSLPSHRPTRTSCEAAARQPLGAGHRPVYGRGVEELTVLQRYVSTCVPTEQLDRASGRFGRLAHSLGVNDPVTADNCGSSEIEMAEALVPHTRQFVHVRQALQRAEAGETSVTALLDHPRRGVLHLDRCRQIEAVNDRARHILRQGTVLSDHGGALRARECSDQIRPRTASERFAAGPRARTGRRKE